MPKSHPKFTQNRQTVVNKNKQEAVYTRLNLSPSHYDPGNIMELKKQRRWCWKNEELYLGISRYFKVTVYICQSYHETESRIQR